MEIDSKKKARKPKIPKLHRKFVNVQNMLQEIQEDVATALNEARISHQVDINDFDLSKLSVIELLELQARTSSLLLTKSKEEKILASK